MEQIIQEPCCIENSLPRLLRQQPLCPWQTNGDVTFDKILKAVAYLAGNAITMLFVVPVVTHPMLHFIAWLWRRGWLSEVRILTTADQEAFIRQELPKELKATIAHNAGVKEGFFRIDGEDGTVVTQGALLTAVTPGHYQYLTYAGRDKAQIDMLASSIEAMFRVSLKKKTIKKQEAKKDVQEVEGKKTAETTDESKTDTTQRADTATGLSEETGEVGTSGVE